jgi:hypothetical protein
VDQSSKAAHASPADRNEVDVAKLGERISQNESLQPK